MTIDLATIDPATLQASPELNDLVAEKWMGWKVEWIKSHWSPSTNPDHAGVARRKAGWSNVRHDDSTYSVCVWIRDIHKAVGECRYDETDGDTGKAEALATCRAIVAALKAREAPRKEGE